MSYNQSSTNPRRSQEPKIEYSFVPNHRDTMEALARSRLSARELRVVIFILNQTDGYLRPEDTIKPAFFQERAAIKGKHLSDVLSRLRRWQVITQNGKRFKVNPPKEWSPGVFFPENGEFSNSPKTGSGSPKKGNVVPEFGEKQLRSKEEPKEELSKDNYMSLNATFEEVLERVTNAKRPQVMLFGIAKSKWPKYEWNGKHIGFIGDMVKGFGADKVLHAIWVAEAQRPVGNPLAYVKAILLNKGRLPKRVEATRGPEDFAGDW